MRKFLMVVAVGALVFSLAAPAMAVDFQFSSSNRFRLYSVDHIASEGTSLANSPFREENQKNVTHGDLRFRPWFKVSDDNKRIESQLRLEIGDTIFGDSGTGGATSTDGKVVEVKWAYLDLEVPFGIPARLRGGLQGYSLPKGAILDDDGAGLRLYGTVKPVSYDLWWLALKDTKDSVTANDDNDLFGGKLDLALMPALNPYVYTVFRHGTLNQESSDGYWFGLGTTGKVGIVGYDLDFIYGNNEKIDAATTWDKKRGWMLDGGVEFPVGPMAIGLRGMYATGDKSESSNVNEDFPSIPGTGGDGTSVASFNPKGSELFWNLNGSGYLRSASTYQPDASNTYTMGGYVKYNPVKNLSLKLDYFFIGAVKKTTSFYTGKGVIGHEIALLAEYKLWTGVKAWGLAGWVIPPSKANDGTKLEAAQAYAFGVQHDF